MAEKSNKNIRFDPHRYPDRANYILKQIKDGLENSHTKYDIEPSSDRNSNAFKSITGTMADGTTFKVEHIAPKTQSESEKMYVAYGNVEFYSEWEGMGFKINIVGLIDAFISQQYVYDMNSNRYVQLPKEMTITDKIDHFLTRLRAPKIKKQKTK